MKNQAKLNKENNTYRMTQKQRVTIQAVNVGDENAVVRFYEKTISAATHIKDLNLPPRLKIESHLTAHVIVCEITSEKVAVGVYHD